MEKENFEVFYEFNDRNILDDIKYTYYTYYDIKCTCNDAIQSNYINFQKNKPKISKTFPYSQQ
jgi:hypothetical protein